MRFIQKVAAFIAAAAISVTSLGVCTSAETPEVSLVDISFEASQLGATTLSVTPSKTAYTFSWREIKGADGYEIYYSMNGGKNYYYLVETTSGVSGITVTTLDPSKSYLFKIRAMKITNSGDIIYGKYSSAASASAITTKTTRPAKTTLKGVVNGNSIELSWTAVPGVEKYQIYVSADKGKTFSRLANINGTKTTATLKNLDPTISYRFKIRSYKVVSGKTLYSKFSSVIKVRSINGSMGTTTVNTVLTGNNILLSWNAVAGAEKYQIYYSLNDGKSFSRLAVVNGTNTSATLKNLDLTVNYQFRIRAYKVVSGKKVYGKFSPVSVFTSPYAPTVITVDAVVKGKNINLTWNAVAGAEKYQIYYSKNGGKTYKLFRTVSAANTSTVIKNINKSINYVFKIRSYKVVSGKKIYGKYSAPVNAVRVFNDRTDSLTPISDEQNTVFFESDDKLSVSYIPLSAISSDLDYVTDYLGQDLYVIKVKGSDKKQVYRITKSALQKYKKTKKLNYTRITVDSKLSGYEWDVDHTRLDTCNNATFRYYGEKSRLTYVTVKYNKAQNRIDVVYKHNGYSYTLTSDGYTMNAYYSGRYLNVDLISPSGSRVKNKYYYFNGAGNITSSAKDEIVWVYVNGQNIRIDKNLNEKVYLSSDMKAYIGDSNNLVFYSLSNKVGDYDAPLSDYHVMIMKTGKVYDFVDFEKVKFKDQGVTYAVRDFGWFNGTKATVTYWNGYYYPDEGKSGKEGDPNEFSKVGIKTKDSAMDVKTGRLIIPVFDSAGYDSNANMYVGFTIEDGQWVGTRYYDTNGRELAKADRGSYFSSDGYALIEADGKLFMVDKNFKRVSGYLKAEDGYSISIWGQDGVLTYNSGDDRYFVVYD